MAATAGAGGISRREFLYYIWGASMAIFTAEFAGLLVWFMLPRFREGEFGGTFTLPIGDLPEINAAPFNYPDGRFWLVNLDSGQPNERMWQADDEDNIIQGVAAIYKVCTHLGCIYAWTPSNHRFECPCHGSKYRLDGRRIESPAPRTLDRFSLQALDDGGNVLGTSEQVDNFYQPLKLPDGTAQLRIDTGAKKNGPSQTLLCQFAGACP
ncbi:MAG: ubiquinol-cytochrome c reductase iron-sulfur subunit [Candidatus Promineifilaceae bacterium]